MERMASSGPLWFADFFISPQSQLAFVKDTIFLDAAHVTNAREDWSACSQVGRVVACRHDVGGDFRHRLNVLRRHTASVAPHGS
jgi:hypothetical protein